MEIREGMTDAEVAAEVRAYAETHGSYEDFEGVNPFTGKPHFGDEQIACWVREAWVPRADE